MAVSFTRSLQKTLITYLMTNMPELQKGYDEFPNAAQKLEFPSISLFMRDPKFRPAPPKEIFVGEIITEGENANKAPVRRYVGQYEFDMQLDFWCENKFQRHDLYEKFINLMTPSQDTNGVILTLADYYNEKVQIDSRDIQFLFDDQQTQQRSEWRFKVTIFGNARCIKEKLEYLIKTVELTVNTDG